MASPGPATPAISIVDAARDAIEHTRRNLFPIRVERWLILGFLAFLDQCGRSLNGGSGGGGGDGPGGDWPVGQRGFGDQVREAVNTATAWLSAHAFEVTLAAVLGLVLIVGVLAVILWLNARGTFMYLDNVASGRADVTRPWSEHAGAAHSYFGWRLGLSLEEGAAGLAAALGLAPVLLLLLLALPLLALASVALRDFVAPLQLTTGLRCGQAARVLETLITNHTGAFVIYLLLKLVLYVGAGVAVFVGGCLTCCIGFLPIVMQVLFQPLFYFERSWSLFVLREMGHDLPRRFQM